MLPFRLTTNGLDVAAVERMVDSQMRLARRDPAEALRLLDRLTLPSAAEGFAAEDVWSWVEEQRGWLEARSAATGDDHDPAASDSLPSAGAAVDGAFEMLKRFILREIEAAERRACAAADLAERRCAEASAEMENAIAQRLERGRRLIARDAARIRREALAEAERLLERAGAQAARLMLDAEDRRREAEEAMAAAVALQNDLLRAVDAARTAVGPSESTRAA